MEQLPQPLPKFLSAGLIKLLVNILDEFKFGELVSNAFNGVCRLKLMSKLGSKPLQACWHLRVGHVAAVNSYCPRSQFKASSNCGMG